MDTQKKPFNLSELFEKGIGKCPATEAMLSYVMGETVDPGVEHHFRYCSLCKTEIDILRAFFDSEEQRDASKNFEKPEHEDQITREQLYKLYRDRIIRLIKGNNLKSAEGLLRKILEINPEDAMSHYLLSLVHHARGQLKQAESASKKALELNPNLVAEITRAEPFLLKIGVNVILIEAELNTITGELVLRIGKKLAGPGKLLFPAYRFRKVTFKGREPAQHATLKHRDTVYDIIVDSEDKSVSASIDPHTEIIMENQKGEHIKGEMQQGMLKFSLTIP